MQLLTVPVSVTQHTTRHLGHLLDGYNVMNEKVTEATALSELEETI